MKVGDVYLIKHWGIVLILEFVEWTDEDNEFVNKYDKWVNVMHCHTQFDMITQKDLRVASKWLEDPLPMDIVVETDSFSAHDLDSLGSVKLGSVDNHVLKCLSDFLNNKGVFESEYHTTGPVMSRGCPLWNFKKNRVKAWHQMVEL